MEEYGNLVEDIKKQAHRTALLVIDVQTTYCSPAVTGDEKTVEISKKINSLAEEFRKASIPVFSIYYSFIHLEEPDFYNYTHNKFTDILIRKYSPSAFTGSVPDIGSFLQSLGIKNVLSCGFKRSACVAATASDAKTKEKLNSFFIEDLSSNGQMSPILIEDKTVGSKGYRFATDKEIEEMGNDIMRRNDVQFTN